MRFELLDHDMQIQVMRWMSFSTLVAMSCTNRSCQHTVHIAARLLFDETSAAATSSTFLLGASTIYKLGRLLGQRPTVPYDFIKGVVRCGYLYLLTPDMSPPALELIYFVMMGTRNTSQEEGGLLAAILHKAVIFLEADSLSVKFRVFHGNIIKLHHVEHALHLIGTETITRAYRRLTLDDDDDDPDYCSTGDSDTDDDEPCIPIYGEEVSGVSTAHEFFRTATFGDYMCLATTYAGPLFDESIDRFIVDECDNPQCLHCKGMDQIVLEEEFDADRDARMNKILVARQWHCDHCVARSESVKLLLKTQYKLWRKRGMANPDAVLQNNDTRFLTARENLKHYLVTNNVDIEAMLASLGVTSFVGSREEMAELATDLVALDKLQK